MVEVGAVRDARLLRVLHVSSGNLYGGVESVLATLARYGQQCPGMKASFALCFEGRLSRQLTGLGVDVHMLGEVRLRYPKSVLRARRVFRELLLGENFDVVVFHAAWAHAIFAPVARRANIPLAFALHDFAARGDWLNWLAGLTPPDLAICNSRFTAQSLAHVHPGVALQVLHCPVPAPPSGLLGEARRLVRQELQTAENDVVIVQIGRLEPIKGHRLHLEALAKLRDLPGWACWQIGGVQRPKEARYLEELQDTAEKLGIADRIRFIGQRADVARLLAAADVYCQPNLGPDAFGITFVEALYAGLPVVTSAMGGPLEIVDESCGILVPPGDARALGATLRALICNSDVRSRLAHGGPARARSISDPCVQISRLRSFLLPLVWAN